MEFSTVMLVPMAVPNLISLFVLNRVVVEETRKYLCLKMGLIDSIGNMNIKGNLPAVTGESGIRFYCPSKGITVTLSATTGNLQAASGVTYDESAFLNVPGNLTGGLVLKNGSGKTMACFAPNGYGQVKIYGNIFQNTGW